MTDHMKQAEVFLNEMAVACHEANKRWWADLNRRCPDCLEDGTVQAGDGRLPCEKCRGVGYERIQRNVGELLMLCVSELSEALEGHRKGLPDDKLPHRPMIEVELADCLIRIFDMGGGLGLDLGGAFAEKMEYNANRADHKIENRKQSGGKAY